MSVLLSVCRTLFTPRLTQNSWGKCTSIHSKWMVKEDFLCQVLIGEVTYDQGLVQQSHRWLGSQSRWRERDADGSTGAIKCHWQVSGSGIFVGLLSVTDGRLTPLRACAGTCCLLNWLLARWYPSVNSILVSLLLNVSHGVWVPSRTVTWHTCSCRWVSSEGTLL